MSRALPKSQVPKSLVGFKSPWYSKGSKEILYDLFFKQIPGTHHGKIKVGGVFVDLLGEKIKVGATFVDEIGYKVKVGGTFVDVV